MGWDRGIGVSAVPVPFHSHCPQSIRGRAAGPGAGLASGAAGAGPQNADTSLKQREGPLYGAGGKWTVTRQWPAGAVRECNAAFAVGWVLGGEHRGGH